MWVWELIGGAVITILFAFAGMIWRNLEGRVKEMEKDEKLFTDKLIEHPILTIDTHAHLCVAKMEEIKTFVEGQTNLLGMKIDETGKQTSIRLDETEKRTGLLIENAILKALGNGKNGARKVKK